MVHTRKKWTKGLTWSNTELEAISRGMGSEAYDYTYRIYPIPKSFQKEAEKELKQRRLRRIGTIIKEKFKKPIGKEKEYTAYELFGGK